MTIAWYGQACVRISTSQTIIGQTEKRHIGILVDPFDETIGLKLPYAVRKNGKNDILLVTHNHPDHNKVKEIKGKPFLINGPGEYEIKSILIQGTFSFHDDAKGKKRGLNTIYTIQANRMRVCHLGDFGQKELTPEQLEKIGDIDVLITPVGGIYTIDAAGAQTVISQIEPKIVIPIHYKIPGLNIKLKGANEFLKIMGQESAKSQDILVVKKNDLPKEETKIIVLKPHGEPVS